MLFSVAMFPYSCRRHRVAACLLVAGVVMPVAGCKRSEPPPDIIKSQREAMDRAKEVGKTMQKAVDEQSKKSEEEGK